MKKFTDHEIENEIRRIREEKGHVSVREVIKRLGGDRRRIKRLIDRILVDSAGRSDGEQPFAENGATEIGTAMVCAEDAVPTTMSEALFPPVSSSPPPAVESNDIGSTVPRPLDPTMERLTLQRRLGAVEARLDLLMLENRSLHEELARERTLRQQMIDRLVRLILEPNRNDDDGAATP